jgi:hypothetical protein
MNNYRTYFASNSTNYLDNITFHSDLYLSLLNTEPHTEELCLLAVKASGLLLRSINKSNITIIICKEAIKQNPYAVLYVPDEFLTEEIISLVKLIPGLESVKFGMNNDDIQKLIVQQDGLAFRFLFFFNKPKEFIMDIIRTALEQNGLALQYMTTNVKDEYVRDYVTREHVILALKQNKDAIQFIPVKYRRFFSVENPTNEGLIAKPTDEELLEMIKDDVKSTFKYIPRKFLTKKMIMEAIIINPFYFKYIPSELITKELCIDIFNINKAAILYFPKEFKTEEMK